MKAASQKTILSADEKRMDLSLERMIELRKRINQGIIPNHFHGLFVNDEISYFDCLLNNVYFGLINSVIIEQILFKNEFHTSQKMDKVLK